MLIGYIRVSKSDGTQTLEPQRDALFAAGIDPSRIYEDMASGRHDARPGLTACLKALQPGNTLVIWKLDRLGRDLRHCSLGRRTDVSHTDVEPEVPLFEA